MTEMRTAVQHTKGDMLEPGYDLLLVRDPFLVAASAALCVSSVPAVSWKIFEKLIIIS